MPLLSGGTKYKRCRLCCVGRLHTMSQHFEGSVGRPTCDVDDRGELLVKRLHALLNSHGQAAAGCLQLSEALLTSHPEPSGKVLEAPGFGHSEVHVAKRDIQSLTSPWVDHLGEADEEPTRAQGLNCLSEVWDLCLSLLKGRMMKSFSVRREDTAHG